MSAYPEMSLQNRAEQPYVGMTASITMDDFSPVVDGRLDWEATHLTM